MPRLLLRLLLCLTLLFNGVAAPWAQAQMRHGDHAVASDASDPHAHHAGMHHAADDPAPMPDDCCASGDCQCGCVLAHALPRFTDAAAPRCFAAAPASAPRVLALVARDSPPFRPPAA